MKNLAERRPDLHPSVARYARHVNPAFIDLLGVLGYGRLFVRARDVWVWDRQDRRYLDFLAGFGSVNVGHNHPRLIARLKEFLTEDAVHFCHIGPSSAAAELGEALSRILPPPLEFCLFSNSGAEAIEIGMKIARAVTKRSEFLSCEGGFHGTNLGALSLMGGERLRKPFEPLLEGCRTLPFGDLEALKKHLSSRRAAAFVVEPIQAEAGVILPPQGYLREAQELCRRYGTLLILDEVQTGLGRTGSLFAFEKEGMVPDILVLAKALSGGVAPIGATITSAEVDAKARGSKDRFDLYSSTFGGNAFSCVTALETLNILSEENLPAHGLELGNRLIALLKEKLSGHPLVADIRGRGLMVGVELGPTESGWMNKLAPSLVSLVSEKVFGQWAALKLLERGVIAQPSAHHWNVLKLEPPLTLQKAELDGFVGTLVAVLEEYQGIGKILKDVTDRLRDRSKKESF